jgi:hypothetical protein
LNVVVHEGLTPAKLEDDVNAKYGRASVGAMILWVAGVVLALAMGAAAIIFLSFLDVFYKIFGEVAYHFELPQKSLDQIYFIGILLLGAAVISFLPRLASEESSGSGQRILKWLLDDDERTIRRLSSRLSVGVFLGTVKAIHIWNPLRFSATQREQFLKLMARKKVPTRFYIHYDELSEWKEFASAANIDWHIEDGADAPPAPAASSSSLERSFEQWTGPSEDGPLYDIAQVASCIEHLLGSKDSTLLSVLLLSSTRFAAEPWRSALLAHAELGSGLVSLAYSNNLAEQIASSMDFSASEARARLRRVFERAVRDYGLFRKTAFEGAALVSRRIKWQAGEIPADWVEINRALNFRVGGLARTLHDSSALFCALVRNEAEEFVSKDYRELMEAFATEAHRDENLIACGLVGDVCAALAVPPLGATGAPAHAPDTAGARKLLEGIHVSKLELLAEMFEGSGRFGAALALFDWLSSVQPVAAHIRQARLLERIGNYEAALELLLSRYRPERESTIAACAETLQQPTWQQPRGCLLAVRYHLQWAWIIFSGGFNTDTANKTKAWEVLDRVRVIADSPYSEFLTPMDRWQLWNYSGLVAEWYGDFAAAVRMHTQAGDLPGIPLRWKGASLINRGVALRREALAPTLDGSAVSVATMSEIRLDALRQSFASIVEGTKMKMGIGDVDEAAVGLHNAAYAALCLDAAAAGPAWQQHAADLSGLGLRVIDASRSRKKRALLVAENLFARMREAGSPPPAGARAPSELLGELDSLIAAQRVPVSDLTDISALYAFVFGVDGASISSMLQHLQGPARSEAAA